MKSEQPQIFASPPLRGVSKVCDQRMRVHLNRRRKQRHSLPPLRTCQSHHFHRPRSSKSRLSQQRQLAPTKLAPREAKYSALSARCFFYPQPRPAKLPPCFRFRDVLKPDMIQRVSPNLESPAQFLNLRRAHHFGFCPARHIKSSCQSVTFEHFRDPEIQRMPVIPARREKELIRPFLHIRAASPIAAFSK
jgi:hypothetical protein